MNTRSPSLPQTPAPAETLQHVMERSREAIAEFGDAQDSLDRASMQEEQNRRDAAALALARHPRRVST